MNEYIVAILKKILKIILLMMCITPIISYAEKVVYIDYEHSQEELYIKENNIKELYEEIQKKEEEIKKLEDINYSLYNNHHPKSNNIITSILIFIIFYLFIVGIYYLCKILKEKIESLKYNYLEKQKKNSKK